MLCSMKTTVRSAAHPSPAPRAPGVPVSPVGRVGDALQSDELPSLAQILEHFRRHGTVALTVAAEAPPPPADEPIAGLDMCEHEGRTLFDEFFGPPER